MRKFISISLVLLLILLQLPTVGIADGSTDIKISTETSEDDKNNNDIFLESVDTSRSTISIGNTFELYLTFKVNDESLQNPKVEVKSSKSFILIDSKSNSDSGSKFKKQLDENKKVSFEYKYIGGESHEIPIIVYYTKDEEPLTKEFFID